jgi:arginyl-tRNA synthetase
MNILSELKRRFQAALVGLVDDSEGLLAMIRSAQDPRFGDYQANLAMPLGKRLGEPPRAVAERIVAALDVDDMCEAPEVAGPGFINLRLRNEWLAARLAECVRDPRLGVKPVSKPRTYVLDYSSPNVAKPMHVGHIRSTVIGDALARVLRFLGHNVITDNHLGDWGTQFGMIIFGYKHFRDQEAADQDLVAELGRLYKLVNQLVECVQSRQAVPELENRLSACHTAVEEQRALLDAQDKATRKKTKRALAKLEKQLKETQEKLEAARRKIQAVDSSPVLSKLAAEHPTIAEDVLAETAKLHADDAENLALWNTFLPKCRDAIQVIYDRLDVRFDHEYGESFYHHRLGEVVGEFLQQGLATESDGAICVFMDQFEAPMIIQKRDGAYLYATTDLATIRYRMSTWAPDAILYVVDRRQSDHFEKLFTAAAKWGYDQVELRHVSFGTVMGEDGKPYKTRSGDTVGLESLLDEAVSRASAVVCANDDAKPTGPELDGAERANIADIVGHAAIKYADLSQNRTSDYVFSFDKMVALEGNTATYMQYSYARTQSIFAKGSVDIAALRESDTPITLEHPMERALAVQLLALSQALDETVADYYPNQLTSYLFETAKRFSQFFQQCHVLRADDAALRDSRLVLCDLTGRTVQLGLNLLGIRVVDKM